MSRVKGMERMLKVLKMLKVFQAKRPNPKPRGERIPIKKKSKVSFVLLEIKDC